MAEQRQRQQQSQNLIVEGKRTLERSSGRDRDRGLEDVSWGGILGGGAVMVYGLTRSGLSRLFLMGVGAGITYMGLKKNDLLEGDFNLKRMAMHTKASEGVEVSSSVTVDLPVEEVYRFWRELENLPRFLDHIEEIRQLGQGRSHWKARLPRGIELEWESKLIEERENELLAWKTVEGSDIYNEGYITFQPAFGGKEGTEVHARIIYRPPAGEIGAKVADFFEAIPRQVIKEDLRSFKQLLEAGERATITGQSSGRRDDRGQADMDRIL